MKGLETGLDNITHSVEVEILALAKLQDIVVEDTPINKLKIRIHLERIKAAANILVDCVDTATKTLR